MGFASNKMRLALFVLECNLGDFLRLFALQKEVSNGALPSVYLKLAKIVAKLISHSRNIIF